MNQRHVIRQSNWKWVVGMGGATWGGGNILCQHTMAVMMQTETERLPLNNMNWIRSDRRLGSYQKAGLEHWPEELSNNCDTQYGRACQFWGMGGTHERRRQHLVSAYDGCYEWTWTWTLALHTPAVYPGGLEVPNGVFTSLHFWKLTKILLLRSVLQARFLVRSLSWVELSIQRWRRTNSTSGGQPTYTKICSSYSNRMRLDLLWELKSFRKSFFSPTLIENSG